MADEPAANLVYNGDYEMGDDGWYINDQNTDPGTAAHVTFYDGSSILSINKPGEELTTMSSGPFPLENNTSYSFKIRYKTQDTDNAYPLQARMMVLKREAGQSDQYFTDDYLWVSLPPSSTWTTVERTYSTSSPINTGYLTFSLHGTGKIWVDGVELLAEGSSTNLINNAGFESGLNGWSVNDNNTDPDMVTQYSVIDHGASALLMDKLGEELTTMSAGPFSLQPNTSYLLKIHYKTQDTDNAYPLQARMMVLNRQAGQPDQYFVDDYLWASLPPSSEWTTAIKTYTTNAQTNTGYLTLFFRGKGKVWVDEVELFVDESDVDPVNLIDNADFENGLSGWSVNDQNTATGTASQYSSVVFDASSVLIVEKPGEELTLASSLSFPLHPNTPYSLSIRYKTQNTDTPYPLQVRMTVKGNGHAQVNNYLWLSLPPSSDWTTREIKGNAYFTGNPADTGYITIFFNGTGKFWVDKVGVQEELLDINGKKYVYEPRAQVPDPPRPYINSITIYQRGPRAVYPGSVPQIGEDVSSLTKSAAPNERAALHFAVYAPQDELLQDIQISDLTNANGDIIPGSIFQKKIVDSWTQRTAYYKDSYYVIPEKINDFEPADIKAGGSQLLWLPFQVPANAAAGEYQGTIQLQFGDGTTRQIPLSFQVMSFDLVSPQADWIMYTSLPINNAITGAPFTHDQQVKYFRDMSDYGITGLLPQLILPEYDYINGQVTNIHFEPMQFNELFSITNEAGLNGPTIWYTGYLLESNLILNITGQPPNGGFPYAENSNPEVQEGFKAIISAAKQQLDPKGEWYYMGIDEPHNGGRLPQYEWEAQLAREAGAHTAATVYPYDAVTQLAPLLDVDVNSFLGNSQTEYDNYMALAQQQSFDYWYLGAGCYTGQEGGLMPNRYLSGFLFYKLGVPAHAIWTYQRFKDDPSNDFDGGGSEMKDFCITYPSADNDNASISTLQWEGIREGIIDYKYAATLQKYIDLAEQNNLPAEAAAGRQVMSNVMAAVPWRLDYQPENSYSEPGNFTNEKADELRSMLANEITRLKGIIE